MVTALLVFGRTTAHSEAAAASISITPTITSAGLTAGVIGAATGKTAVVSVAAAGALAVGAVAIKPNLDSKSPGPYSNPLVASQINGNVSAATRSQESWYYYPAVPGGPVMMRLAAIDSKSGECYTRWWQYGNANYQYDRASNTVSINNHRTYNEDMTVFRLPTDNVNIRDFLTLVDGASTDLDYVPDSEQGLLVLRGCGPEGAFQRTLHHHNLLEEEYFKYNWPPDATVVDKRDDMHRQGWAWMKIEGTVRGRRVTGTGRIPFVYDAAARHYPWLNLTVEGLAQVVDDGSRARIFDASARLKGVYAGGEFFAGLSRPWMGLHTIDTVRRDAATRRYWFDTEYSSDKGRSQVTITCGDTLITYSIDMEKDLIESITFAAGNDPQEKLGELRFSYLPGNQGDAGQFSTPRRSSSQRQQLGRLGTLWLLKLANTELGK